MSTLIAAPVSAQPALGGVVEDACVGSPQMPGVVRALVRSKLDPSAPRPTTETTIDVAGYKAAMEKQKSHDWGELCRYPAANKRDAALPSDERRIVYFGDSLTELWEIADPAFFTGGRLNRGISGQTTGQMLVRFEADVVALHPKAVHIWAGTNDLAGNNGPETMAEIHNNVTAMVALARAAGIKVVIAALPPIVTFPWRAELRPAPQARALNAWLRSFAEQEGAVYVDYDDLLVGPDGATQAALTFDTLHLNRAGYDRIRVRSAEVSR